MKRTVSVVGLTVALGLGLTACGGSDEEEVTEQDAAAAEAGEGAAQEQDAALTYTDGWVKATDEKMTGMFGTIENTTDQDLTLVEGSSDAVGTVELHEVVDADGKKQMQAMQGGMTVPAGEKLELKPGGLHIMLMKIDEEIKAGDEITVQLVDDRGGEYEWSAQARSFDGGDEDYGDGQGHQH